ncbi:MAG: hotdog fold thioesterase [Deltaproteobacteria bacterium]|nr:MAG: hotdog fold thioesterase [Deltaproteobacteria bacterium]
MEQASQNTLGSTLGIKIIELTKDKVVGTMPVDHRTHQPYGLLHGGASVALAETVASVGGMISVLDQGKWVVGLEINANHLSSVRSGIVTATGTPIHQGRSTQVWEIKIHDEQQKLICISRCTLAVRDKI